MIDEPYPDSSTQAGVDDIIQEDRGAVAIKSKYRELNHELPYPHLEKITLHVDILLPENILLLISLRQVHVKPK